VQLRVEPSQQVLLDPRQFRDNDVRRMDLRRLGERNRAQDARTLLGIKTHDNTLVCVDNARTLKILLLFVCRMPERCWE